MSNRLRKLRNTRELTLPQLSKQLKEKQHLYLTPDALSKYERGEREPKLETWDKLAKFFNVSVGYIQGLELTQEQIDETTINVFKSALSGDFDGAFKGFEFKSIDLEQLSQTLSDILIELIDFDDDDMFNPDKFMEKSIAYITPLLPQFYSSYSKTFNDSSYRSVEFLYDPYPYDRSNMALVITDVLDEQVSTKGKQLKEKQATQVKKLPNYTSESELNNDLDAFLRLKRNLADIAIVQVNDDRDKTIVFNYKDKVKKSKEDVLALRTSLDKIEKFLDQTN